MIKKKNFIRASNAPHRSLPAIPISTEPNGDTCSDLYATVGDKMQILQEEDMMSRKPINPIKLIKSKKKKN